MNNVLLIYQIIIRHNSCATASMRQFLFFLLITTATFAQDFSKVSEKIDSYPKLITAEKLAAKIASDFSSNKDKIKAIFYWMTHNIRYDLVEFRNPRQPDSFMYSDETDKQRKLQAIADKIVAKTLRTRKGVCEGYAATFSKLCDLLSIENEIIEGYVRFGIQTIGNQGNVPNHAWNAVKLNGKWQFIDATWAAGAVMYGKWKKKFNPYYFDIPKRNYFKTHYPEDSLWQLRVGRMEKDFFYKQPIYYTPFLESNASLVTNNGTLYRNKEGKVTIPIKNLAPEQNVLIGISNSPYAKKPERSSKNNITTLRITVPKGAKQLYVVFDRKSAIGFLIK